VSGASDGAFSFRRAPGASAPAGLRGYFFTTDVTGQQRTCNTSLRSARLPADRGRNLINAYRRARGASNYVNPGCGGIQPMDVTGDHSAQNLSACQRDVMKLIVRALSNKEIASILNLAEGTIKILTAKECLQSAEACLASAHKTKELDTRAALLEFAYELRTVAKSLEREERKLMVRAASPIHGECAPR